MLEEKNPQRTPLSELGEFGLIDHLTQNIKLKDKNILKGVGDDASVTRISESEVLLTSTDMLVEGIHFDLAYVPLKHLGYKAAAVNFSDIYAMNGRPTQIVVSIAVSNRFPVEALEEIYDGLLLACDTYGVDLVGGDTTSSLSGLVINVTVLGTANEEEVVYRSGAKPNDLLVVSGDLGGAYMGLQLLEREKQVYKANPNMQPDLDQHTYIIERLLKPEARKDVIEVLNKLEVKPTSMIDVSDGLSSEILHLCKQSDVGVKLFEEKIPIDPSVLTLAEEWKMSATTVALNGGEDYELLFTIPVTDHDKIKGNPNFTPIGHITEPEHGRLLITRGFQAIELTAQGWDPLLKKG